MPLGHDDGLGDTVRSNICRSLWN